MLDPTQAQGALAELTRWEAEGRVVARISPARPKVAESTSATSVHDERALAAQAAAAQPIAALRCPVEPCVVGSVRRRRPASGWGENTSRQHTDA